MLPPVLAAVFLTAAGLPLRGEDGAVTNRTYIGILFVPPLYVLAESLGRIPKLGRRLCG